VKILIAYDGSASGDAAVEDLRRAGLPPDAEAFTLAVAAPSSDASDSGVAGKDPRKTALAGARTLAESAARRIQSYFPQWRLTAEALCGSPSDVILKTSGWWRPDLLIIGYLEFAHVVRPDMGSVSLEVVHQARCSVRVTPPAASLRSEPILLVIGSDGSSGCDAVIRAVSRRSWPGSTEALVMSFVEASAEHGEQERERLRRGIAGSLGCLHATGLLANGTVKDGDPRQELVREAERSKADMIFVGAGGSAATGRFLAGGTSTAVVTKARCTVEVVR
jgi:nucleotide-binding universal stress UspA family protein